MTFDDIKAGDAVNLRDGSAVVATDPVKEKDGMRIVAWQTNSGELITEKEFSRFCG